MASDVSSAAGGQTTNASNKCKSENSPEGEDKSGGTVESKLCGVCGDKALGHNFNAITCESCKAFFRRNALRTKEFICPFSNECKVDAITRRFCQRCRLKKCFDIGMKKEWIMTDEEKKMKKQKIEQNRKKRTSLEVSTISSGKQPCRQTGRKLTRSIESVAVEQFSGQSVAAVSSSTDSLAESDEIVPNQRPSEACKEDLENFRVQKQPMRLHNHIYAENTSNYVSHKTPDKQNGKGLVRGSSLDTEYLSSTPSPTASCQSVSPVPSHTVHQCPQIVTVHDGQVSAQHQRSYQQTVSWTDCDSNSIPSPPALLGPGMYVHSHEAPSVLKYPPNKRARIYDSYDFQHHDVDQDKTYHHSTPLLSSLIQPGHPESSPDYASSPPVTHSANPAVTHSSGGNTVRYEASTLLHRPYENEINDVREEYERSSTSPPSPTAITSYRNGYSSQYNQTSHDGESDGREFHKNYREHIHRDDSLVQMPPIHTMDSILSIAIAAEFNSFGMMGGNPSNSKALNKAEQAKLNELLVACQALHAPVDADRPIPKESESSDTSLLNVINLTEIAIRRLIKMSKKISGFKNMCQEDQIALLKGGCTEMMILRSAVTYDPDRDSWQIPHSNPGYNINLGVLKAARGNLYEEHQRFNKSFRSEWRTNENIMIILCAITLFTPERPNVIHRDVVKLEQDSYYYLLKRYLESVMNGCEAKSNYLQLIRKIAELRALNSSHVRVFLEMNPKEVEPLLIEIFDLK